MEFSFSLDICFSLFEKAEYAEIFFPNYIREYYALRGYRYIRQRLRGSFCFLFDNLRSTDPIMTELIEHFLQNSKADEYSETYLVVFYSTVRNK